MSRIIKLGFLLTVLFWIQPLRAANIPIWVNNCSQSASNFSTVVTALSCTLNNVTSGNTVIVLVSIQGSAETVVSTGGETVTCPAGALATAGVGNRTRICYMVLGSSHASITVSYTMTGTQAHTLIASEMQGVGAVDAGSAGGGNNSSSISTTTAGSNEIVFNLCNAFVNDMAPGSGFKQIGYSMVSNLSGQDYRSQFNYQVVAGASTITSACTNTNLFASSNSISALAFSISGAPAPPTVGIVRWCEYNGAATSGAPECKLYGTSTGNKVVIGVAGSSNSAPIVLGDGGCTQTCVCPVNAQTPGTLYAALFITVGVCYADVTSPVDFRTVVSGGNGETMWVEELSGINTGVDAGSEANAVATTVNFTTAVNNEYSVCFGGDNSANPMSASGGSFVVNGQAKSAANIADNQGIFMSQTSASSGSHTCSYSMTGSTQPLIATLSFGLPATGSNTPSHANIIDFHPHQYRFPWIPKRKRISTI